MDSSVVFWEFLVIAFIFTATIIASEFVRRWLEKIEKDNIQSETETSNLVFAETDCQSCDPHFLVVEEIVESVPMDSSSLRLFGECAEKGPNKPITSLEELESIESKSSTLSDEDDDNIIKEIEE